MPGNRLSELIDDRPEEGVFRVSRAIFDDSALFDLEMARIFEGGWVFLGIADQAPAPHDFFTTTISRVPVLGSRDAGGTLGAFVNSCMHKGSRLAQTQSGNARLHVCPYHSWTYDSARRNRGIKLHQAGCLPAPFESQGHDLARLPAFEEYRGFLFGSLGADVPPLAEHLNETTKLLDLVADQSAQGFELVPGGVTFTFAGNWKLQLENCSDAYHFTSAHPSYLRLLEQRQHSNSRTAVKSVWEKSNYWKEDTEGDV